MNITSLKWRLAEERVRIMRLARTYNFKDPLQRLAFLMQLTLSGVSQRIVMDILEEFNRR